MSDSTTPPNRPIIKPDESLEDAPFDAPKLIKEVVSPAEAPLKLRPPPNPWTLPTSIGVAEEMAPVGAVEVGGAGTGTWVWLTTLTAAYPVAAVVLLVLAVAAIGGTVWWAVSTPKSATKAQIEARADIANNPLPDNPAPFIDASDTGFDGQWRFDPTNERLTITHNGNKYYAAFGGVHWVLDRNGKQLKSKQALTASEVVATHPDVPADIAAQLAGAPAVVDNGIGTRWQDNQDGHGDAGNRLEGWNCPTFLGPPVTLTGTLTKLTTQ